MITREMLSSGQLPSRRAMISTRPVFFRTDYEPWHYATYGGTLFLIERAGRILAMTCKHVFQDFEFGDLIVPQHTRLRKGSLCASIKRVISLAGQPAEETDLPDLCLIEFGPEATSEFFFGTPYTVGKGTFGPGTPGNTLHIFGVRKDTTIIDPPRFDVGYWLLEATDRGPSPYPALRWAEADLDVEPEASLAGMSGAPVFDVTADRLCGMVCRAGIDGRRARIHYFDVETMIQFVDGALGPAVLSPPQTAPA